VSKKKRKKLNPFISKKENKNLQEALETLLELQKEMEKYKEEYEKLSKENYTPVILKQHGESKNF
jgi:FtsZ-binding cell division protein ZapB